MSLPSYSERKCHIHLEASKPKTRSNMLTVWDRCHLGNSLHILSHRTWSKDLMKLSSANQHSPTRSNPTFSLYVSSLCHRQCLCFAHTLQLCLAARIQSLRWNWIGVPWASTKNTSETSMWQDSRAVWVGYPQDDTFSSLPDDDWWICKFQTQ